MKLTRISLIAMLIVMLMAPAWSQTKLRALNVGGGYGSTGVSISAAGVIQANGAITTDGALTYASAVIGGGYGATGVSISAAGVIQANGAITTDGALTADNIVCTNAATFGGGYGSTGATISTAGVGQFNGALTTDGNLVALSADFGGGSGGSGATITAAGALTVDAAAALNGGITVDTSAFTVTDVTGAIGSTSTRASQTLENIQAGVTLSTDSTYITGTNITYSGARGSSAVKLTGTYSGVNGGYSNLYSIVNSTGTQTDANAGIVAEKVVINNTVAQTAGNFTAVQGIAKHNDATVKAANAAPFIGVEGVVNQSAAGQIGTGIGVSAAYHIPADAAVFDGGAVWRGIQITCDNASGNSPSEETGLAIWNMTGTQTNGIKLIKSASGFTNDITLQNGETIDNAVNGTIGLHGALNLCAAGGTTAASVGILGGAGASGAAYSLGAGAAGVKGLSFYLDSTSTTTSHSLEGLYINVDYGVGAASGAPFGEAGRFRARLMGDSAMTVAGSHSTVEWGQAGASTTGLVAGSRSNLVFVDSTAGGGTITGAQAELFSGGSSTDLSGAQASIMRLVIDGTVTANKFTVPVFDIVIPSALEADDIIMDTAAADNTVGAKLRIRVNGTPYWIMLADASN